MMERPCLSSFLARAKTASAPSPVSCEMRDAIRAMAKSRILPFVRPTFTRLWGCRGVPSQGKLDGCENKGLAEKTIRENMKTKGERTTAHICGLCVVGFGGGE